MSSRVGILLVTAVGLSIAVAGVVHANESLQVTANPSRVRYGALVTVKFMLAPEMLETSAAIALERRYVGESGWRTVRVFSSNEASAHAGLLATDRPRANGVYRARSETATSSEATVSVTAIVTNPLAPPSATTGTSFTLTGYLKPKHPAGTSPIRIRIDRRIGGVWRHYGWATATASDYSGYTKYTARVWAPASDPHPGVTWRFRAYHADEQHAGSWSPAFTYTIVKSPPRQRTITLMTYNILNGAGVDTLSPGDQQWLNSQGWPGNRLKNVLAVIRAVNPDIIGIQEAMAWDVGRPSVIEKVARELRMNYALGLDVHPEAGLHHVAILTKYDLSEVGDYGKYLCSAGMRATVTTPEGIRIRVFNAHLTSPGWSRSKLPPSLRHLTPQQVNEREVAFLASKAKTCVGGATVVMGDLNNWNTAFRVLGRAGFRTRSSSIDQIWLSPTLNRGYLSSPTPPRLSRVASDHEPVMSRIRLPAR